MLCHICGAEFRLTITDMPFQVGPQRIVILKALPVLQCENCGEYLLQDAVMAQVEESCLRAEKDSS